MKTKTLFALILFCCSLASGQTAATTELQKGFLLRSTAITGCHLETWAAGSDRATQLLFPLAVIARINRNFGFDLSTGFMNANFTSGDYQLGGMNDIKTRLSWRWHDLLLATIGINLPTGRSELADNEIPVANVLSYRALDFSTTSLGQGFDAAANVAVAWPLDLFSAGGGLGVLLKGTYNPYVGQELSYKPGNEYSLQAGGDFRSVDKRFYSRADLLVTFYGNDKADNVAVYRSGTLWLATVQARYNGILTYEAEGRFTARAGNQRGTEILQADSLNTNASEWRLHGRVSALLSKAFTLFGEVRPRYSGGNSLDADQYFIFGLGGGGALAFNRYITVNSNVLYNIGSLGTGHSKTMLQGAEVFLGVTGTY